MDQEISPEDYICCLYANADDDRLCVRNHCLFNMGLEQSYWICMLGSILMFLIIYSIALLIFII